MQLEFFNIPSPCVGVCKSDARGYCLGCKRTRDERQHWVEYSNDDKQRVIKRLIQRTKRYVARNATIVNDAIDRARANVNDDFMDDATHQEINAVLYDDADISELSIKATTVLYWVLTAVLLPLMLNYISGLISNNHEQLKEDLKDVLNKSDIAAILRRADTSYLLGYRITTGDNLYIRADSNRKSDVLATLRLGTVIEVVEDTIKDAKSAHKSWIKVSAIQEDAEGKTSEIIGWVYRRYTLPVR